MLYNEFGKTIEKNNLIYIYITVDNLNICKKNNMYSINPLIFESNDNYNNIKNNIQNGSIVSLNINKKNVEEINNIINYIMKKGYKLNYLSKLVEE